MDTQHDHENQGQHHADPQIESFDEAIEFLDEITQLSDVDPQLIQAANDIRNLGSSIELADWNSDIDIDADELVRAVINGANLVRSAYRNANETADLIEFSVQITDRYSDLIQEDGNSFADEWYDDHAAVDVPCPSEEEEFNAPSAAEIGAILAGLQPTGTESEQSGISDQSPEEPAQDSPAIQIAAPQEDRPEGVDDIENLHDELRQAFLDDGTRCLAEMEKSLLSLESDLSNREPLQELGRELHTLKGASSSIGLSALAAYIHDVEDAIRKIAGSDQQPQMDELLKYLDTIRARVDALRVTDSGEDASSVQYDPLAQQTDESNPSSSAPINFDEGTSDKETVRIKASRLNRMMDMLSELVMLRNQRDTELSNLIAIHDSLVSDVSRLRTLNYEGSDPAGLPSQPTETTTNDSGAQLNEIANDIVELAQGLRECYQPVADGNHAVSQFIRGFRQELVELRRTPIEGLFLRLRRAISDAARAEEKQVKMVLRGEDTGIDRALQARLFEPLLHIVRNAVSHGIESPADRVAAGKPEQGEITLQAFCGPDLLSIEVRDDGKGLDYDAIRRRGQERGLIDPNSSVSRAELAQLIFHPGFSTRDVTTQISGRGVGMDVVAATLERMRGWVEVDSALGQGSTIRLSLPLPSMIQHAMVFRSGGQLFAIPMQAVQSAGEPDSEIHPICVNELLELKEPATENREMIVLGGLSATSDSQHRVAILVDQIIGPEEVVVRPLPRLFKQHPICSGATLSGLGEAVLLLDAKRLVEAKAVQRQPIQPAEPGHQAPQVLVVDDSSSARLRTTKSLSRHDFRIVQAHDGQEAWESIQNNEFSAVFSDIEMPNMTGLQLLEKVKNDPSQNHLPVVLISSRTEDEFRDRAAELGAVACLPKPLNDDALDALLADSKLLTNPSTN